MAERSGRAGRPPLRSWCSTWPLLEHRHHGPLSARRHRGGRRARGRGRGPPGRAPGVHRGGRLGPGGGPDQPGGAAPAGRPGRRQQRRPGRPRSRDRPGLGVAAGRASPTPERLDRHRVPVPSDVMPDLEAMREFQVVSDFAPAGDQPAAIAQLSEGVRRGDRFQTLLGHHRQRQERHHRLDDRGGAAADPHHRPQQVAGRPAGQRDARVLPAQPGRVLRQLLRLLPARGLPPLERHLHREGQLDQRRDRPAAPLRHLGPADPAGHHRGGLGQLHLRPGLARGVRRPDPARAAGRRAGPAGHPAPAGRHAVRAQRRQPGAGQVPGAGRHHRGPSRPTRSTPSGSSCSATRSSASPPSTPSPARSWRSWTSW